MLKFPRASLFGEMLDGDPKGIPALLKRSLFDHGFDASIPNGISKYRPCANALTGQPRSFAAGSMPVVHSLLTGLFSGLLAVNTIEIKR